MPEETTQEQVNIITTYEAQGDNLKIIKTPEKVIPTEESYNIASVREELARIDNVIAQWEAKKAPLQAIIDKYNEVNAPVLEEEIREEELIK